MLVTRFKEIDSAPESCHCLKCHSLCVRYWKTQRTAIDVHIDGQALLNISVGVYYCRECLIHFRFQPDYIKPSAMFTNRVVNIAVASVIEDGMPVSKVCNRLKRDFGVKVAESSIRSWITKSADMSSLSQKDSEPVVVSEASGVLCMDEAYTGGLAILLATDPLQGDKLIGYLIKKKSIKTEDVEKFLKSLSDAGIDPKQVVTDESSLYPKTIEKVWPNVAHQLCLFHMTKKITEIAKFAVHAIKRNLPKKPKYKFSKKATRDQVVEVLNLHLQGKSLRKIAKLVGVSRNSTVRWTRNQKLTMDRYNISADEVNIKIDEDSIRVDSKKEPKALRGKDHPSTVVEALEMHYSGFSQRKISVQLGVCRNKVANWVNNPETAIRHFSITSRELKSFMSKEEADILLERVQQQEEAPPKDWKSWEQVQNVKDVLSNLAYSISSNKDFGNEKTQRNYQTALKSPIGNELKEIRLFLEEWYDIWYGDHIYDDSSAECLKMKWDKLKRKKHNFKGFCAFQGKMSNTLFESLSTFLYDEQFQTTSNSAERYARKIKKIQKSRYRIRSQRHFANHILLAELARQMPLKHEYLSINTPYH